jgi:hypothetical protein
MIFPMEIPLPVTEGIIKSIGYNQDEIIANIIKLHTGLIELDATYGSGCFYKRIPKPKYCFDIAPRKPGVVPGNVLFLPIKNETINSALYDPPFMARTGPGASMKKRFGELVGKIEDLWDFYEQSMLEFYRVLKPNGWLVFKLQNGVLAGVNNNTYREVCNRAERIGLKWVDEFVLLATHRMMHPRHKRQIHARKYHCFFVCFKKTNDRRPKK